MVTKETVVNNQVGLHARPATFFIQKANEFKSSVWVEKEERRVNAKSLLGVLSLGIVKGTPITLIADGPDEEDAVNALVELINSDFSEYVRQLKAPLMSGAFFNPVGNGVPLPTKNIAVGSGEGVYDL